jgi:hypothetical protein
MSIREISLQPPKYQIILWLRLEGRYKDELLALLKLLSKDRTLGFSFEQQGDEWNLFIHLSKGAIQISGDRKHRLKTRYRSLR